MELLPSGAKYYKANLHCHTTRSDGKFTPEEIKNIYQEKGYQVVAFTDHNVYHNHVELNDENFVAIASFETDINDSNHQGTDFSRVATYHLNWYDTRPDYRVEEKARLTKPSQQYHDIAFLNQYISEMKELGFLSCYNHPYWSLQNYEDYKGLKGLWGMEIYNHGCEMDGLYGYHPQAYDEMLRAGQKIFCVSTDDNHNKDEIDSGLYDSFGGYIMIAASELTYQSILESLQKGNFYSCTAPDGMSLAPEIYEMSLQGHTLTVKCSPADKIFVKTMGRNCYRASAKPGETITEATFQLTGKEGYIRLDIADAHGRHTNSNAYYVEEIIEIEE